MVDEKKTNEPSVRFPRERRIRKQREFDVVWKTALFAADHVLVVKAAFLGATTPTRLGLSVGRKHGNAVVRNRWKRLIRDSFRRNCGSLSAGLDLVVGPQKGAQPVLADVEASLIRLVDRIAKKVAGKK